MGITLGSASLKKKKVIIKPKIQSQIYLVMSKELKTVQHFIHVETPQSQKYKFHFKIQSNVTDISCQM